MVIPRSEIVWVLGVAEDFTANGKEGSLESNRNSLKPHCKDGCV
jgi:hypothetical protein